jgi:hypothetical protein
MFNPNDARIGDRLKPNPEMRLQCIRLDEAPIKSIIPARSLWPDRPKEEIAFMVPLDQTETVLAWFPSGAFISLIGDL